MGNNLMKASHVYVKEKIPGYAESYGICDLYMLNLEQTKQDVFFFYFQQRKFYYNKQLNNFTRLKPKLVDTTTNEVLNRTYEN